MGSVQLEFNLDGKSDEDVRFSHIQKQVDEMSVSVGKVRKRLFAELSEVKKLCADLVHQNEALKKELADLKDQKTEWLYCQDGFLLKQA